MIDHWKKHHIPNLWVEQYHFEFQWVAYTLCYNKYFKTGYEKNAEIWIETAVFNSNYIMNSIIL